MCLDGRGFSFVLFVPLLFFVCIRRSKGGLVRLLRSLDADKLRCVVFVLGT